MRKTVLVTFALVLAGCGTPQEQCTRSATRDLRTLDNLIAATETSLARGYAYEEREITRWAWVRCYDGPYDASRLRTRCWEPYNDVVREPVAIDPVAEARKLEGLKARRAALVKTAMDAVEDCRARYPETGS